MAKVPNGVETVPKISTGWVWRTNITDDRWTDNSIYRTRTWLKYGKKTQNWIFNKSKL